MTWREYNIKSSDVTAWLAHLQSQDDGKRLGSCFQPAPRSANLEAPDSVKSRNTSMKPSSPRPFMIWKKCLKIVFSSLLKATILHQYNNYWLLTESKSSTAHPSGLVQLHANPLGAQKAMRMRAASKSTGRRTVHFRCPVTGSQMQSKNHNETIIVWS